MAQFLSIGRLVFLPASPQGNSDKGRPTSPSIPTSTHVILAYRHRAKADRPSEPGRLPHRLLSLQRPLLALLHVLAGRGSNSPTSVPAALPFEGNGQPAWGRRRMAPLRQALLPSPTRAVGGGGTGKEKSTFFVRLQLPLLFGMFLCVLSFAGCTT
ncbi:hypothetical protein HPB48_012416 [Haemaphysalis longicornis]|uniref:Uncharacterized protein n=1 Tax=Haemaphysalis longicornis TaxID=44386 RepID=A0A9J6G172_HAELO|nr:hypothetical protein HPB48_012416 [Haemaphysalis longicornis]